MVDEPAALLAPRQASIVPCVLGYLGAGWALDRGARALYLSIALMIVSAGATFGALYACVNSVVAAWLVTPAMLMLIGAVIVSIGLPVTRLYRCGPGTWA